MKAASVILIAIGELWLFFLLFLWALNRAFHGLESSSSGPPPGLDTILHPGDPTLNARWTSSKARSYRMAFEFMKRALWFAVAALVVGVALLFA